MMTGWLIYDQKQYDKNKWLADEIIGKFSVFSKMKLLIVEKMKFGISNDDLYIKYDNEVVEYPNFAVIRTIFPFLTEFLEKKGVRTFNNSIISNICNDKRKSYLFANKAQVDTLDCYFYDKRYVDDNTFLAYQYPLVLKSIDGHGGKEVFLVNSLDELKNKLLLINSNGFLIQKVCKSLGKDLRVYVLGGKIIASMLRSSSTFKSNYSLGGSASIYVLNDYEVNIVNKIINVLPCCPDLVGIDFLLDNNKLYFNEIEDVVGMRMLYEKTDINPIDLFAKYVESKL